MSLTPHPPYISIIAVLNYCKIYIMWSKNISQFWLQKADDQKVSEMPKAKMKRKGVPASAIADFPAAPDLVRFEQTNNLNQKKTKKLHKLLPKLPK